MTECTIMYKQLYYDDKERIQEYRVLDKNLYMYITEVSNPWKLIYSFENTQGDTQVKLKMDFTGSENIILTMTNPESQVSNYKVETCLYPFKRKTILELSKKEEKERSSIKSYPTISRVVISIDELKRQENTDQVKMIKLNEAMEKYFNLDTFRTMKASEIVSFCNLIGYPFIDQDFKPWKEFITNSNEFKPTSWRHADDFHLPNILQVINSKNGALYSLLRSDDNCFCPKLRNALYMLSYYPHLLDQIFALDHEIALNHTSYNIRLFCKGQKQHVLLDYIFPCYAGSGPYSMTCHDQSIWAMLIEKGIAKMNGSYIRIKNYSIEKSLEEITGYPITRIKIHEEKNISQRIIFYKKKELLCYLKFQEIELLIINYVEDNEDLILILLPPLNENESSLIKNISIFEKHNDWRIKLSALVQFKDIELQICHTPTSRYDYNLRKRLFPIINHEDQSYNIPSFALSTQSSNCLLFTIYSQSNTLDQTDIQIIRILDDYSTTKLPITIESSSYEKHIMFSAIPGEYIIKIQQQKERYIHKDDQIDSKQLINSKLNKLFQVIDIDMDGFLSKDDIGTFLRVYDKSMNQNDSIYKWISESFDSHEHKITFQGFLEAYFFMREEKGINNCVEEDMKYYSKLIEFNEKSEMIMSLHSEKSCIELVMIPPFTDNEIINLQRFQSS